MTDTWMFSINGELKGVTHDKPEADDWRAHGFNVVPAMCVPATDYAAMQSRITRLEEAIKNTLKYMDRLDGMIGPFHPNDFGAAHLRAALEEK